MNSILCPSCGTTTTVLDQDSGSSINCRCGRQLAGPDPVRKVGKYAITGELGRGSFGSVYLAEDEILGRRVALKVPHPHVLNDPELRERFLQEAQAVARLQHRCIVVVFEIEKDGRYIATEYLPGRTLREELENGSLPVDRAVWIAAELADALAHAHASGIIHRDLKPSNVILTDKGEVKLIDFGLAKLDTSAIATRDQAIMGTLLYMSPEQVAGETRKVREPSDQYNLGAVLYEMLTGTPPHGREGRYISIRISQKARPPSTINSSIPASLDEAVMRTLERVPVDRYPTCRALAEDLRRLLKPPLAGDPQGSPGLGLGAGIGPGHQASPGTSDQIDPTSSSSISQASKPHHDAHDPPAFARYRPALGELQTLVTDRAAGEERISGQFRKDSHVLEKKIKARRSIEQDRYESTRDRILVEKSQRAADAKDHLQAGLEETARHLEQSRTLAVTKARNSIADAEEKLQWSIVQADGILEARRAELTTRCKAWRDGIAALRRRLEVVRDGLGALVSPSTGPGPVEGSGSASAARLADPAQGRANARVIGVRVDLIEAKARSLIAPGRPGRLAILRGSAVGLGVVGLIAVVGFLVNWIVAGVVALVLIGSVLALMVRHRTRARAARIKVEVPAIGREIAELEGQLDALQGRIDRAAAGLELRMTRVFDASVFEVRARFDAFVLHVNHAREERLEKAGATSETARIRLQAEFGTNQDDQARLATLEAEHKAASQAINEEESSRSRAIRHRRREDYAALAIRWRAGMGAIQGDLGAIADETEVRNPPWNSTAWDDWAPPIDHNPIIRFAEVRVGLDRLPHGIPEDPRLMQGLPAELAWPVVLRLQSRPHLLIDGPESAADPASLGLQSALIRLVAGLPAGQVRLTIVDPIGLGGDFGPFLQLADLDESLATLRTDPGQIEQGLADLVGHIRKMFRNYFRADIRSIYEFNRIAQEVAEPIRILVVAGFPHGFSQAACDYLARIFERGAQCGVIALVGADRTKMIPGDLTLAGLAKNAVHLSWKQGRFVWEDDDFGSFPLVLDPPPPPGLVAEILNKVGSSAVDARRVQIPFEVVAPAFDRWWTFDSRAGIEVPLGKSGLSKFQSLTLGRGTSQHVLVAGRTGSGKSTLLHALITNLALHYHPNELELYLIDFKKGVEFNIYAVHELPHARVIAIESEREFGISVLQRLDDELKERGERFRQAGVQDLKGYRSIPGLPPLPRVLLIVDEFQEFFIEDDTLAAKATLLLDRLVRQGRAFGVHALLGSQSLGGAYSLARATFGQMSVRIALQCSETDSRIILSEDNGAARLLSRSGEAIYNDANGTNEGNHFFQVVWQPEEVREEYLRRIRDLARARDWTPQHPPVIFEGNAASILSKNLELRALIASDAPRPEGPIRSSLAYLGEAVEIKGPTAARFRRLSGDNLLIIGQDAEAARGMMTSALVSLAAQYPASGPGSARFWILAESEEGDPGSADLARTWDVPPQRLTRGGRLEASAILRELAKIVADRAESNPPDNEEHFLFIYNTSAFRMLQRPEDEYSAEARDPDLPSNTLALILKDGSALGVHLIVWSDGLNNLNRTVDRQLRREFGTKVAMQMSSTDSANLLDSSAASHLGYHRALFSDEAQGRMERFRPYAPPPSEWTDWVRSRLDRDVSASASASQSAEPSPSINDPDDSHAH